MVSEPTLAVSRARTGQVRRIRGSVRVRDVGTYAWRVGPLGGARHGMYAANWTCGTRMPILDVRTWPTGDVPGLGTDEDVGLLRGVDCNIPPRLNRINSILIPPSCNFFSGSPSVKNSRVKRAWPGAISGWVTDREVFPGAQSEDKSAQKRLGLVCRARL
jgi:hypothetical protein